MGAAAKILDNYVAGSPALKLLEARSCKPTNSPLKLVTGPTKIEYLTRTLTPPQEEFFLSQAEYTAGVAGFGAGKTDTSMTRILTTLSQYPGIDQAYLAPTYPLIRDIFYPKISDLLGSLGWHFKINKQENTIYIPHLGKIICRTMDNPDMLVGWDCGDAVLDEFDVLPTDKAKLVIRKVAARCRQKYPDGKKNQKWVATTPEGFKATYQLFKKNPLKNSKLVQMSTYSNAANLPEDYIENLMAVYPENLIAAYLMGEFVNLTSGTVYNFDRDRHNTKEVIAPGEALHIGQDFNYGGCISSIFVIRDNVPYLLDGMISKDTATVAKTIKAKYAGHFVTFYPDSSGDNNSTNATDSDIKILKKAGFRIVTTKSNPLVRNRVNAVNAKLDKGQFFINCDRCPEHAEALEQQAWDVKTGNPKKEDWPGSPDDYNDSIGYFMVRRFPIMRPTFGMAATI